MDTNKRELVGDFKAVGREFQIKGRPVEVRGHDFKDKELGHAIPFGVYDLAADEGWVSVGITSDTATFAVNSILSWWEHLGKARYPDAATLTITADSGGSNSPRTRLWRTELQRLKRGRFKLKRITITKRMRAKLQEVKEELKLRRHRPVPEQGQWLASVVRGHLAYYAVPDNIDAVGAFRTQVARHWFRALRRRSQRNRLDWQRMNRLVVRWLPRVGILHPWPDERFDARTRGRSPVR